MGGRVFCPQWINCAKERCPFRRKGQLTQTTYILADTPVRALVQNWQAEHQWFSVGSCTRIVREQERVEARIPELQGP